MSRATNLVFICLIIILGHVGHASSQAQPQSLRRDISKTIKALLKTHSSSSGSSSSSSSSLRAAWRGHGGHAVSTAAAISQLGIADKGKDKKSTPPPAECGHGSITYIKCWLDEGGFVTGLAFESPAGSKAPQLCSTDGEPAQEAFLYSGEKILDIISCRSPSGGIARLTFHTDSSRVTPITCGYGGTRSSSKLPGAALGSLDAESASALVRSSPGDGSEPAGAADGQADELCESLTLGRAPAGSFEISSRGPRLSNRVQYQMQKMYPIGGLTARCGRDGPIQELHNTCWDRATSAPSVNGPVLLEVSVQLNDGPAAVAVDAVHQEVCTAEMCADEQTAGQLSAWVATALPHMLAEMGSRDVWVKHSVLGCKPCSNGAATTLRLALALYPQQGELRAVEHTLKALMGWSEKNLCRSKSVNIGCMQAGVGVLKLENSWVKASSSAAVRAAASGGMVRF